MKLLIKVFCQKINIIKYRKYLVYCTAIGIFYLLLISPIFFLYPNYSLDIKKNIEDKYFENLSKSLTGDCLRKTQEFMKVCPFPTREIHLSSNHTICEILINEKWYAYETTQNFFFNDLNIMQISYDFKRGQVPNLLKDYTYLESLKNVKYYHNNYFVFLKFICPFYDSIVMKYYSVY
jgi:hypothetical protein